MLQIGGRGGKGEMPERGRQSLDPKGHRLRALGSDGLKTRHAVIVAKS